MKKVYKLGLTLSLPLTFLAWNMRSQISRQNTYGAYLSFVNSCRSAWIVYESFQDYQKSLSDITYNSDQYHQARHEVHMRVANRILKLSKQNRGIYLKLGQYLGNLEKVVPWQFTHVLKVLQDTAPPLHYEQMKVIFQSDLNRDSSEIFSQIDEKPLASASLAQVHRGRLTQNNKQVAIKMQYPFLRIQSKWDLIILKKLTKLCNYLVTHMKNANFDFVKLFNEWTSTLVEELDFNIEVRNALKIKQMFKGNDSVYIPEYYTHLCSDRLIVMQFTEGVKVNQHQQMIEKGIDPKKVRNNLLNIFATMVFKFGFVHCDAHPGNFFIRKKDNSVGHEIVLLDHGLYRSLSPQTIRNFSGLLVNLLVQDKQKVMKYAQALNIHEHFEYLPIIFLQRLRGSTKPIGDNITEQQRRKFRKLDLANFDSINQILQDLPPQLMYIIRTFNLVSAHFNTLGGSTRERIFVFTQQSLRVLYRGWFSYHCQHLWLMMRVWFFEAFPGLYSRVFGLL